VPLPVPVSGVRKTNAPKEKKTRGGIFALTLSPFFFLCTGPGLARPGLGPALAGTALAISVKREGDTIFAGRLLVLIDGEMRRNLNGAF